MNFDVYLRQGRGSKKIGFVWHYGKQFWLASSETKGLLGAFRNKRNALAAVRKAAGKP